MCYLPLWRRPPASEERLVLVSVGVLRVISIGAQMVDVKWSLGRGSLSVSPVIVFGKVPERAVSREKLGQT